MIVATTTGAPRRTPLWGQLYVQVLVAIVAGVVLGHFWPSISARR